MVPDGKKGMHMILHALAYSKSRLQCFQRHGHVFNYPAFAFPDGDHSVR